MPESLFTAMKINEAEEIIAIIQYDGCLFIENLSVGNESKRPRSKTTQSVKESKFLDCSAVVANTII